MKIGVLNIDWFKKSKNCKVLIQEKITMQNFDFLIVNENILNFQFDRNYFEYHSKPIPTGQEFQQLDYGLYLKGETPVRSSIYSKYKATQTLKTSDPYTSICHKFNLENQEIVIYATIIGTWGIKYQNEIAKVELEDFKADCQTILAENENVFIIGDFNTSFIEIEQRQLPIINSRTELQEFTSNLNIFRATEDIDNCIDHIFISNNVKLKSSSTTAIFLENNCLKDNPHKGILMDVTFTNQSN